MRCKNYRYSLKGLTENRCPECGRPFDPNDPSPFEIPQDKRRAWIRFLTFGGLTYLGLFVILIWDALTQPTPPPVIMPGITATYVREPLWECALRSAVEAMTLWPFTFAVVFVGWVSVSVIVDLSRRAISALSVRLR